MDKRYFKEIFQLEAEEYEGKREKRINYEKLQIIFGMVGFEPNAKQDEEFK